MNAYLNPPLTPRNGHTLEILIVCRVSDPRPGKQDERSLADQEAKHREWLEANTDLPYRVTVIAGSGSGECLERGEYLQLLECIESGKFDLVLTEDLGRIVRRIHAHLICEECADNDVRLIALNDSVDTEQSGWQDRSIFSAWHHERSNRDTSERIKRTHRSRFNQGGCLALLIFGYRKAPGAKGDDDLEKMDECGPTLREWFRRLDEDNATYAEIADWLNEQATPTGPYCREEEWTGTMVGRVTHNWLLKGKRFRNKRKTRRNNKSGKYISEKATPEELVTRHVPHLAFFEEAYYNRVIAKIDARNAKYRRSGDNERDPLLKRPRKRTRYPGQSVHCGVCGRLYVFGGHGQKEHLMCSGAREHKCWNGITFDGPDACRRLSQAVYSEIELLPAFEPEFLAMLQEELLQDDARQVRDRNAISAARQKNQRDKNNILGAIREHGSSNALLGELRRLEQTGEDLDQREHELQATAAATVSIPTIDSLKEIARERFHRLAVESQEFARLMRELLPSVLVFPFRLCDGGAIALRASVTFSAFPLVSSPSGGLLSLRERLTKRISVDLFEPPQRAAFRERVMRMRCEGRTERQVAAELGITITAAQKAAALQRQMNQLGIGDPWQPVAEPPTDYGKLRRHLHKRYRFEPLDGFPRNWFT